MAFALNNPVIYRRAAISAVVLAWLILGISKSGHLDTESPHSLIKIIDASYIEAPSSKQDQKEGNDFNAAVLLPLDLSHRYTLDDFLLAVVRLTIKAYTLPAPRAPPSIFLA